MITQYENFFVCSVIMVFVIWSVNLWKRYFAVFVHETCHSEPRTKLWCRQDSIQGCEWRP